MSIEVCELLYEFDRLENILRNSMMPHEWEIIKGLNIVKEIIKELNPEIINLEFKNCLETTIIEYKMRMQSQMKIVDSYVDYGISRGVKIVEQIIYFKNLGMKNNLVKIRR